MNKTLALLAFAVIGTTSAGFALAHASGEANENAHPHHAGPAPAANMAQMQPMHDHMMQMHAHMMSMHAQMAPNGPMGQISDMPCIDDAEAKTETETETR